MLIPSPNTKLTIDIPSIVIDNIQYKRKLIVLNLQYSVENKTVSTEAIVSFFDFDDQPITGSQFIKGYGVRMVADNTTYCDMQGLVLCTTADAEADPSLIEGKDYMMQFDWFYMVASSQPIVLNEMIKQFYLRAVQSGRFN